MAAQRHPLFSKASLSSLHIPLLHLVPPSYILTLSGGVKHEMTNFIFEAIQGNTDSEFHVDGILQTG